ncbi:FecR family protein [Rhizobium cremeum]|uniref:FecR family protein n=1 Tax=Rhizobium cremeum TaxID=2813827 RepID=UPI001FD556FF|nr:FecR family protein [Rhizobium cremeum]MCJ7995328.1 FecR family protein [Rhizobium cremeum]MCJ8000827.1 FecR family protein [Rhizobium cremeum]
MKKTPRRSSTDETDISRAAAEWFARLLDEPNPAAHQQFRAWLLEDERHARAYAEFERLWSGAGLVGESGRASSLSRRTMLKGGGLVIVAGGAGFAGLTLLRSFGDYSTGTGETKTVTLPDGTRIELSPQTAFSIDFSEKARRVRLMRGEIFVSVVADPSRPFAVETDDLRATALGTQYSVAIEPEGTSVFVTQHAVEVTAAGRREILNEGQSLSYRKGRLSDPVETDIETRLAWRSGKLVFLSAPFGKVIADIERWRRGKIVLMDPELADRPVTLIVDVKRSDRILDTLQLGLPVRIVTVSPWLALVYTR